MPPADNLHLTLAFLGELDDGGVARSRQAVSATADSLGQGWVVGWGSPGAFPSLVRARVLWLGLADTAVTAQAETVLASHLRRAGLPVEDRPFKPHLTLARLRSDLSHERADELKQALADLVPPPAAEVMSLVLYRSRLGRGRPSIYEELSVAPLA